MPPSIADKAGGMRETVESPSGVVCRRRVGLAPGFGEKRRKFLAPPGGLLFRSFLLAAQKKWTPGQQGRSARVFLYSADEVGSTI
jgi:hypothetical protein